MLSTVEFIYK